MFGLFSQDYKKMTDEQLTAIIEGRLRVGGKMVSKPAKLPVSQN